MLPGWERARSPTAIISPILSTLFSKSHCGWEDTEVSLVWCQVTRG